MIEFEFGITIILSSVFGPDNDNSGVDTFCDTRRIVVFWRPAPFECNILSTLKSRWHSGMVRACGVHAWFLDVSKKRFLGMSWNLWSRFFAQHCGVILVQTVLEAAKFGRMALTISWLKKQQGESSLTSSHKGRKKEREFLVSVCSPYVVLRRVSNNQATSFKIIVKLLG